MRTQLWNLERKFTMSSFLFIVTLALAIDRIQSLTSQQQQRTTAGESSGRTLSTTSANTVGQLDGEAGYRMATLQWKFPETNNNKSLVEAFRVRYCERHTWGLHRCRYQIVDSHGSSTTSSRRTVRKGKQQKQSSMSKTLIERNGVYKIDIGGLRMATNYSFEIAPQPTTPEEWDNRIHVEDGGIGNLTAQISLQTKGFSAQATSCLADSSVVVIETGPFFGGRISVEGSDSPACSLKGDPQSAETKYTLRIRHAECGSVVNNSRVTTVILVQENLSILTHSTRRFVVVCTFSPESFIVKAGVSLPRGSTGVVGKSMDFSRLIRVSSQNSNLLVANKDYDRNMIVTVPKKIGTLVSAHVIGPSGSESTEEDAEQQANQASKKETDEERGSSSQLQVLESVNENSSDSDLAAEESSNDDAAATTVIDPATSSSSSKEESNEEDIPVKSITPLQQHQEFRPRQSRAYLDNTAMNDNQFSDGGRRYMSLIEPRNRNSGDEGSVEGYLLFGMVAIVVVTGLASVLWFIKSSYSSNSGAEQQLGDDESSISGGSSSSDSSGRSSQLSGVSHDDSLDPESLSSSETSHVEQRRRSPRNLDTRSEFEVELDFEFSDEIHTLSSENNSTGNTTTSSTIDNSCAQAATQQQTPKPKLYTLDLDERCQQLSSASRA